MLEQVTVTGLHRRFGKVMALRDVNLTIRPGMFGLLGPNGAGKTTLLRILTTVLPPSSGTVQIGPYRLDRDADAIRQVLGYLPQDFNLYGRLTARENLDYFACLKGIGDKRQRRRTIARLLDEVNLAAVADRKIAGFSGGMRRRLGIAQALLSNPQLLVVDEPTAGLDPEERLRFRDLLAGLARDRIVILSTHIVADIEEVCDQIAVMAGGTVAFAGTPEALRERSAGRVWEIALDDAELDALRRQLTVLTTRRRGHRVWARVLAADKPHADAVSIEPSLEDAYLALLGQEAAGRAAAEVGA